MLGVEGREESKKEQDRASRKSRFLEREQHDHTKASCYLVLIVVVGQAECKSVSLLSTISVN